MSEIIETISETTMDGGRGLRVLLPGSGSFMWWQLGTLQGLDEHKAMIDMVFGISGGALASALWACRVDQARAESLGVEIMKRHDVWSRTFGFFGIWGMLIREWLDELLPEDAAALCTDKLNIIIGFMTGWETMTTFDSRDYLIECLLASIHIPFVMDGWPYRRFHGRICWDAYLITPSLDMKPDIVFMPKQDKRLSISSWLAYIRIFTQEQNRMMHRLGIEYALSAIQCIYDTLR